MIWLVELATLVATQFDVMEGDVVTWLQVGRGRRCLVEANQDAADRLRQQPHVLSLTLAPDDLYVDPATRTVWEVSDQSAAVRLLGYIPS
jgi:hypothetical protein